MKNHLTGEALRGALRRPSAWVLVGTNLLLIAGVAGFGWSVLDIVFLYWVENLVIGAINVLRMLISSPSSAPAAPRISIRGRRLPPPASQVEWTRHAYQAFKLFIIPFFIVHYGGFCYVHGIFVVGMFGNNDDLSLALARELLTPPVVAAIALLAASHLFSFVANFILSGEYRRSHAAALMMRPYGRIVALHLTILLGALLVELLGSTLGLLIVLVVAKTIADLALHEVERGKLGSTE